MIQQLLRAIPFFQPRVEPVETTPGGDDPVNWVRLLESISPSEALVTKALLESEGIPVVLQQESIAQVMGLSVGPLAWTDLWVPDSHETAARLLLEDVATDDTDDGTPLCP